MKNIASLVFVLVLIFIVVYMVRQMRGQKERAQKMAFIAKPDWYNGSILEWTPHNVLYDGGNLYYSPDSKPK